jgi:hypothetical protein
LTDSLKATGEHFGVGVGVGVLIPGMVGVGDNDGTLGETVGVGGTVGNGEIVGIGETLGVLIGVGVGVGVGGGAPPLVTRATCRFKPS